MVQCPIFEVDILVAPVPLRRRGFVDECLIYLVGNQVNYPDDSSVVGHTIRSLRRLTVGTFRSGIDCPASRD